MKKAMLLLGMMTLIAGCIFLKNADCDTILYLQKAVSERAYGDMYPAKRTEEIVSTEQIENTKDELFTEDTENVEQTEAILKLAEDACNFVFSKLNMEEQIVYAEILNSLLTHEEETILSTIDASLIDKAFTCVMLDHPEIFYVDGYKYTEYTSNGVVKKVIFTGNYLYNKEECMQRQAQIDAIADRIIEAAPDTADDYDKVKYIFDTIVNQTEYDISADDNQNICSVFLGGRSVCQGYAKAVQYLLNRMQIPTVLVLGRVLQGDGHAWNLVLVNNNWYYLDATWGDAFYLLQEDVENPLSVQESAVNYDYFCVTTQQLKQTHIVDMPIELPECTAWMDNYYVREGLYFTSYEEERIAGLFADAALKGQETVTIKCSSAEVYNHIWNELIEEQKVFHFIDSDGTIAYTDNAIQGSITFWIQK